MLAIIPARAGSKRIPHKNLKNFCGHPLFTWTVHAAFNSHVFDAVAVTSDSAEILEVAGAMGAAPIKRPAALSTGVAPDIGWLLHALGTMDANNVSSDSVAILRPTSPFRTPGTIRRAAREYRIAGADSIRAVEPTKHHPMKSWMVDYTTGVMHPVLDGEADGVPCHSLPYQRLPEVYAQNASLEIVSRDAVLRHRAIHGSSVAPFFTHGYEGFDLNTEDDWSFAEWLVESGRVSLGG